MGLPARRRAFWLPIELHHTCRARSTQRTSARLGSTKQRTGWCAVYETFTIVWSTTEVAFVIVRRDLVYLSSDEVGGQGALAEIGDEVVELRLVTLGLAANLKSYGQWLNLVNKVVDGKHDVRLVR